MSVIPIISSAADLPGAIKHAERNSGARWYVVRRAEALGVGDKIPPGWGITATAGVRPTSGNPGLTRRHTAGKVEAMTVTAAGSFETLHPRDRNGQFIEKLDILDVFELVGGTTPMYQIRVEGVRSQNGKTVLDGVRTDTDQPVSVTTDKVAAAVPVKAHIDGTPVDAPVADADAPTAESVHGQAPDGVDQHAWDVANDSGLGGLDPQGEDRSFFEGVADREGVNFDDLVTAAQAIDSGGGEDPEVDLTVADDVEAILEQGDVGEYSPEEITSMVNQLDAIGRHDLSKHLDQAFTEAGGYDDPNDDGDPFGDEPDKFVPGADPAEQVADAFGGTPEAIESARKVLADNPGINLDDAVDKVDAALGGYDPSSAGPDAGEKSPDKYSPPGTWEEYKAKADALAAEHGITMDEANTRDAFERQMDLGDLVAYYEPGEPDPSGQSSLLDADGTLGIETRDAFAPLRDLLDVDHSPGSAFSGMSDYQMESLSGYTDDYADDPEAMPDWARESLDILTPWARDHDVDVTDVIGTRRSANNLGWAQEEQLRNILNGESIDEQNGNAVANIADWLGSNPMSNRGLDPEDPNAPTLRELGDELRSYSAGGHDPEASAAKPDPGVPDGGYKRGTPDPDALMSLSDGEFSQLQAVDPGEFTDPTSSKAAIDAEASRRDSSKSFIVGDTGDPLQDLGELYRNDAGNEVWRIHDRDGNVVQDDIASDDDARFVAEREVEEAGTPAPAPAAVDAPEEFGPGKAKPTGDAAAADKLKLMLRSAEKPSSRVAPDEAATRLNNVLINDKMAPEARHSVMAKLMTDMQLGGKQRKRYRELLDSYIGTEGGDSAKFEAAATAEGLSDDNPVKEKLAAKAAQAAPSVTGNEEAGRPEADFLHDLSVEAQKIADDNGEAQSLMDAIDNWDGSLESHKALLREIDRSGGDNTGVDGGLRSELEERIAQKQLAAKPKTLGGDQPAASPIPATGEQFDYKGETLVRYSDTDIRRNTGGGVWKKLNKAEVAQVNSETAQGKPKTLGGDQSALPTDLVTQSLTPGAPAGGRGGANVDTSPNSPFNLVSGSWTQARAREKSAKGPAAAQSAVKAREAARQRMINEFGVDPDKFTNGMMSKKRLAAGEYDADAPSAPTAESPGPSDAEKVANAEKMFGTDSPQHQAAQAKFGEADPKQALRDKVKGTSAAPAAKPSPADVTPARAEEVLKSMPPFPQKSGVYDEEMQRADDEWYAEAARRLIPDVSGLSDSELEAMMTRLHGRDPATSKWIGDSSYQVGNVASQLLRELERRKGPRQPKPDVDSSAALNQVRQAWHEEGVGQDPLDVVSYRLDSVQRDLADPFAWSVTVKPAGGSEMSMSKEQARALVRALNVEPAKERPMASPWTDENGVPSAPLA